MASPESLTMRTASPLAKSQLDSSGIESSQSACGCQGAGAKTYFKISLRGASSATFVAFLVYMMVQSSKAPSDRPLVQQSNLYLPLWYTIVYVGGILPTVMINAAAGKWTAPPFNYPPRKSYVVYLHVIPAVLWLLGSALQVFWTTVDNWAYHRVTGNPFMTTIFVTFELTAVYSLVTELSPLGHHVKFMEWSLVLGTFVYFALGMFYVSLGADYHIGHKICMNVLIIDASGPALFRVLRHFRELVTGRLFKCNRFTNYADIPGNPRNLKNMHNVESTYFVMGFLVTNAYASFVLYKDGVLFNSPWSGLAWSFLSFPVVSIVAGILLRFVPGINEDWREDFNWTPALDYNWQVLEPVADVEDVGMSS